MSLFAATMGSFTPMPNLTRTSRSAGLMCACDPAADRWRHTSDVQNRDAVRGTALLPDPTDFHSLAMLTAPDPDRRVFGGPRRVAVCRSANAVSLLAVL